jgi:hypothetical protein
MTFMFVDQQTRQLALMRVSLPDVGLCFRLNQAIRPVSMEEK